jgi:hypothetical protein
MGEILKETSPLSEEFMGYFRAAIQEWTIVVMRTIILVHMKFIPAPRIGNYAKFFRPIEEVFFTYFSNFFPIPEFR